MAACLGVFACLTGRALAHEPPYGTGVYARGEQLVVRNTRGLVFSRGSELRFLCNEALGVAEYDAPSVILREDQSLLVGSSTGLWRVSSNLCEIDRSDALPILHVNALRLAPDDSAHIYAATELGLYESRDEGQSFTQLEPHAFDSLELPASDQGSVYAAGKLASAAGQPQAYFAHGQRERGFELQEFALDANEYGVELLGSDARRIFAVAHAYLGTQFKDRLLVSNDSAHTWQSPLSALSISAFSIDAALGSHLLASAEGLWRISDLDSSMVLLHPAAVSCLARVSRRLLLCDGAGPDGGLSQSSDEGEHWRSVLRWNQLTGLAECPSDSPAVAMCQLAWDDWQREMPAGPPLAETSELEPARDAGAVERNDAGLAHSPTPKSCAAVSGTHPPGSWLWLALYILPTRLLCRRRTKRIVMNRTVTVFLLLLVTGCAKHSGSSHAGAANSDGGTSQDASSPASPNMLDDASIDAAQSGDAGSGHSGGAGGEIKAQSGSGGSHAAAGSGGHGSVTVAGGSGGASAGQGGSPISQDAGTSTEPDADSGPATPTGLCTSCGGCEETPKVVSAMHTTAPVMYSDPPPSSGPHNPCWGRWGVHDEPLAAERWVHNLEHGGVVFLYNCPAGCDAEIATIKSMASTRSRTIVTSYAALPKRFGVVSWGHRMVSECMDEQAFKDFLAKNFDRGPESNANPPNPSCPP